MSKADDKWAAARMRWEADPSVSGGDVAREMGVTRNAVNQRIKRDQWRRINDQADLARRAHDRADVETAREQREDVAKQLMQSGLASDAQQFKGQQEQIKDIAVDMRANILARHRKELDGSRNIVYDAIRSKDFDKAKLGKITAEALVIIQNGERKAWGLDSENKEAPGGVVKVVIERRTIPNAA